MDGMNLRRLLAAGLVLGGVLAIAPAPAHAAPAISGTFKFGWRGVEFYAAPGIANDLWGFTDEAGTLLIYDQSGQDIAIDPAVAYKCTKTYGHIITVSCKFNAYLFFQLGDMNDRIRITGPKPVTVQGGAGNDQLDVSAPDSVAMSLYGGPGDDKLWGGPGDDLLDVGTGNPAKQSIVDYYGGDNDCRGAFDYSVGCDRT